MKGAENQRVEVELLVLGIRHMFMLTRKKKKLNAFVNQKMQNKEKRF